MLRRLGTLLLLATLLVVAVPGLSAQSRGPTPLRIVLLIDSSYAIASMLPQIRAGLNSFLAELPGLPEIALLSTGGQMRIRVGPTTDREQLRKAAASFAPDGGANSFLDSLLEADKRFLRVAPDRRPVFVIVTTDGTDIRGGGDARVDEYNRFVDDFLGRRGRAHALVIKGVTSTIVTEILLNLTQNTGGYYDSMTVANPMAQKMKTLAAMVAADMPE